MHNCPDPKEVGLISMITLVVHSEDSNTIQNTIEIIHNEYGEYITCITGENVEVSVKEQDTISNYGYYLLSISKDNCKLYFPNQELFTYEIEVSEEEALYKACRKLIEHYHQKKVNLSFNS